MTELESLASYVLRTRAASFLTATRLICQVAALS